MLQKMIFQHFFIKVTVLIGLAACMDLQINYTLDELNVKIYIHYDIGNENGTFMYAWGDDEVSLIPTDDGNNTEKTYSESGYFDITLSYFSNTTVEQGNETRIYVGKPIGKLLVGSTTTNGFIAIEYPLEENVTLPISVDGSDVEMNITLSSPEGDELLSFMKYTASEVMLPKDEFRKLGMYIVDVNASNPLTLRVSSYAFLVLQTPVHIENVICEPLPCSNKEINNFVKAPFTLITNFTGIDVTLWWRISTQDVVQYDFMFFCLGHGSSHNFTFMHNQTGIYEYTVFASNYVKSLEKKYTVGIYDAIDELNVTARNLNSLMDLPLDIDISWNQGNLSFPDGSMICHGAFGDGEIFNESMQLQNQSYEVTHNYTMEVEYNLTVRCSLNFALTMINRVEPDQMTFELGVLREFRVENLTITHDSSNKSHHPISVPVTFDISLKDPKNNNPLGNLQCRFESETTTFGEFERVGDVNSSSNLSASVKLSPGDMHHKVSTNCSKKLTYQEMPSIDFYVYYDCWRSQYFDAAYRDPANPRQSRIDKGYEIKADIKLKNVTDCKLPLQLDWRVFDPQMESVSVESPNVSTFPIRPYMFDKNKTYRFELNTTFTGMNRTASQSDFTYVSFFAPDLQTTDDGTTMEKILKSDTFVLDTSNSIDPGENPDLGSSKTNLQRKVTCRQCPQGTTETDISLYAISDIAPPGTEECTFNVHEDPKIKGMFTVPPHTLTEDTWFLFEVLIWSGTRESTTKKAVHAYNDEVGFLTLDIVCVSNCHSALTIRDKLRQDVLRLNCEIRDNFIDKTGAMFWWSFERYDSITKRLEDQSQRILGSRKNKGLTIGRQTFDDDPPGSKYQVSCRVKLDNEKFGESIAFKQYVLNQQPYNGRCMPEWGEFDTVTVGNEVCVSCSGWLDEGMNEERDPARDDGRSLVYSITQRFLKKDGTIDPIYRGKKLVSSFNLRQCVIPELPEGKVDNTMIEVRVKDDYEKPYAPQQFILKIKAPDDISGSSGIRQLMQSSSKTLSDALIFGDTSTLFSTISALASVLPLAGNRRQAKTEAKISFSNAGINDVKPDGTKLTASEAMDQLKKPTLTETEEAVITAKHELVEDLVNGEQRLSEKARTKPLTQTELVSAAAKIKKTGETLEKVIHRFDEISEQYSDTIEYHDFAEELVHGMGVMTDAIVDDELEGYLGIEDQQQARDLVHDMFEMGSDEKYEKLDESDISESERETRYLYNQLELGAKLQDRVELGQEQSHRIQSMLETMTKHVPVSDSGVNAYGGTEQGQNVVKVTSVSRHNLGETTITGSNASVGLPDVDTDAPSVRVGLYEGTQVANIDLEGRFAHITSNEVYLNIDSDSDSFNGQLVVEFEVDQPTYKTTEPNVNEADADDLHRQNVYLRSKDETVCLVVKPLDESVLQYNILVTCSGSVSKLNYDVEGILRASNGWRLCFPASQLSLKSSGVCNYGIKTVLKAAYIKPRKKRSANNEVDSPYPLMNISAATMAFMVWDEVGQKWESDKCAAQWDPVANKYIGQCPPRRKMTFANSFYVPPNRIDFDSVFLKFSPLNQAAIIATLAVTFVLYILLVIWARRADKHDLLKWGVTSLSDNFAEDNYFYVIKVYTGLRPGAGTRSKIGIVVSGDETDTGQRKLSDGVRTTFSTGSVINFLMATPVYLGSLEYVRIWHDNSGRGNKASWYLSKLEIQDVQRNETFSFLAERWLAVEKDDGLLECVVPVCHVEILNVFKNRFYRNAKESLAESHMWVSVVYRPLSSNFTRVQRVTCALVFIMTTMITNAMFYKTSANYETPASAKVGPFRFELQEVYIALVCVLITTPATLLICYLFKLAKYRTENSEPMFSNSSRDDRYKVKSTETSWLEMKYHASIELEKCLLTKGFPSTEGFHLPYWSAIVAWCIAALAVLLSGFFLLLYSMEWGRQKSEEWLTTFCLSFFESVFFLDPVKVFVTALLYALIIRTEETSNAIIDRKTIMKTYTMNRRGQSAGGIRLPAPPLDKQALEKAREVKERDIRMKTAMKDIIINVFIIWISFSISYSSRDRWSYHMHKETVDALLQTYNPNHLSFYKIKTMSDYFEWLNDTALVTMFPEYDVSGQRLHWRQRQFLKDGSKIKVGPPRLRQLRTTRSKCNIPYVGEAICNKEYSDTSEDTTDYCVGWNEQPCDPEEKAYMFSSDAWKFTSAFDIWGIPIFGYYTTYGGGGYITKLSVNREISETIIGELRANSWIDSQSRAVLFEFTLYCISTNIFTYNIFLAEFPVTGGVFPYAMILPIRVYMHVGSLGIYTLICEVIYLFYLVVISIMTAVALYQQKLGFFRQPWQVYDLIYIVLSYVAICMYFVRLVMTNKVMAVFQEDKKEFVNFFHIALWDQLYVLLLGILVFMATLRMLNVLGYNKRISAVARVFSNAATDIIWFGIFFLYVYICYAVFGYLLFGSNLKSYKDVYKAMGTLFISMIGKSRFSEIEATDPIFSKVYFMIFIFFVVYMILTMFLAVLTTSIDQVHKDVKSSKADEMVEYVINKFKNFLTFKGHAPKRSRDKPPSLVLQGKDGELDSKVVLEDIRTSLVKAMTPGPEGEKLHRYG